MPEPFEDSRRLTGCNVYFAGPGAALESARGLAFDDEAPQRWRTNIALARTHLGWPDGEVYVRHHASGVSLAFAAPLDQLYAATEINEWAWWHAVAFPFSLREKVPEGRMRAEANGPDEPSRKKFPLDEETLRFVRHLRAETTDAEQLFWLFLRDRRLHGQKFRRQKTLDPYVLDFYCHELKLAIELDGGQHNDDAHTQRDARRDAFVANQGIQTLRYWNHDALQHTEDVLADISAQVRLRMEATSSHLTPTPSSALRAPSPGGRRENQELYHAPGHAAAWDEASALETLRSLARAEANPALIALHDAAAAYRLPFLADDDETTLGAGTGGRSWFIDELPTPETVPWAKLHGIPAALVTGSNGKTTTVRLIAAMCRAHGWHTAHSCTDGVFFDGNELEAGDFSGPAGARTALRQSGAQAAVLETARGGLLRRGLALCRADAAVVTNVSVDHFGEYGVHDLEDLTRVKLTVARAIGADGLLVLNADDERLREHAKTLSCPLGWFALDFDHPLLAAHRQTGGAICGVRDGHLRLHRDGAEHDLGAVAAMPLTLGGRAGYNIANIAAAALAATAMDIAPATIMATLAVFGTVHGDNPGRLQYWRFGDMQVFVDYAHNPEGLQGLFDAVGANARRGRLALLLGHAGNREDADLRAVAAMAASVRPDFVVLKDIAGYERGRAAGEIAAIMRAQLLADGVAETAIATRLDETEAARTALAWARDGDLLVLPIHEMEARARVGALLDEMTKTGWKSGDPLPWGDMPLC